jgi:hypothetical protein
MQALTTSASGALETVFESYACNGTQPSKQMEGHGGGAALKVEKRCFALDSRA